MAEKTWIEWADATWNPWWGCHKVSTGCKNCYMFRDMKRYGRDANIVKRTSPSTFNSPLKWANNYVLRARARIFTCSYSDWFIEEADEWRNEAWDIIRDTPQFDYLILTKRPENIKDRLPKDWENGYPNVWLGISAENQAEYRKRWPLLPINQPWRSSTLNQYHDIQTTTRRASEASSRTIRGYRNYLRSRSARIHRCQ